ncbi:MAG TPA: bifunctional glutamate N-acetyltransferase/amino-acid acetyltransferase ArgJ [Caulobacteraceae bacterium]|nr:bifunctional glutamate N-acetyltransferase/amino-acid acetyltransferase ArgJ [Caulobacteraceae bacterium]
MTATQVRSPLAVDFPLIEPIAGVELASARAGLYRRQRDDVMIMRFAPGTTCAGVFTRHGVGAAPVDWSKSRLRMTGGRGVRGLVVNAGCANSFTGKAGAKGARRVAEAAAKAMGVKPREVMLASTGVIGVLLDDRAVTAVIPEAVDYLSPMAWPRAAGAIVTTDTFPKGTQATAHVEGHAVRIAGIAKGSGMIAPNMATMLAFIATDAAIEPRALSALTKLHVARTFNSVTVDGDRSTNDTLLVFATGQSGAPLIAKADDPRLADFSDKLGEVMLDLAQQLVRDGEGASKYVKITVSGARNEAAAHKIARTIAESPLVKTALAGEDANWGRIVMAAGRADERVRREKMSVSFGHLVAAHNGTVAPGYSETAMSDYMKNAELEIAVDVGVGHGSWTMWTCDLTKAYVAINGDYRS